MLEYNLDLTENSYSRVHTPDVSARAFPFYLTEFGYFEAREGYFTRRDGKAEALLLYTLSGQGELTWKGQSCALQAGSAVLVDCEKPHFYRTAPGALWRFHWLHLDGPGLAGFRSALLDRLTPIRLTAPDSMSTRFAELQTLSQAADVLSLAEISHCLSSMLILLLRSLALGDAGPSPLRRDEVRAVAEFIHANLDKPLTTEDFVRVANLSKYHLIHLFRQQMGVPPYRYLQRCRVNRAQELLRTTPLAVSEIGARVGWPDPVNFIRHFRDLTGTTPARYRRESITIP